jgi:hypothetical protein
VEANSTGGQGSRRAVEPGDDDDEYVEIRNFVCINIINVATNILKKIWVLVINYKIFRRGKMLMLFDNR